MTRQLQENTREFQEAYKTLKGINEKLNDLESVEDAEQFIDDTTSISVVHDIYDMEAEGFIIDITVNGPYTSLDTVNNVITYVSAEGSLEWYPKSEKTRLVEDYIIDYLYQA